MVEAVEALTHELVHAVDHAHDRCKFATCEGLAFSEVRAARDAECDKHFYFELAKGQKNGFQKTQIGEFY